MILDIDELLEVKRDFCDKYGGLISSVQVTIGDRGAYFTVELKPDHLKDWRHIPAVFRGYGVLIGEHQH